MAKKTCKCNAKHTGSCACPSAGCAFPGGHETPCGVPVSRTPETIANEYARAAAELGDLVYRRDVAIPGAISDLEKQMADLNAESAALPKPTKES